MIIFWIVAAGLVCLALGLLLPPLLRARTETTAAAGNGNLRILRDHLHQLERDQTAGLSTPEEHATARAELERRVLEEVGPADVAASVAAQPAPTRATKTAWGLALLVPLLALGLYALLGTPAALNPQAATQAELPADQAAQLAELNALVDKLGQRMANERNNLEGWTQLGRAYAMLQRFEEAKQANSHAMTLGTPSAQLLADQAGVLAILQGQNTRGEPDQLIALALAADPHNAKALVLAGSAAFERRDFALATRHWAQALQLAPAGSEQANSLESGLAAARSEAQAQAALGVQGGVPETAAVQPPSGAGASATAQAGAQGAQIKGTVQLAPALADKVAPGDTLFVYARAEEGPRMPLAIVRTTAQALPFTFTLDDSSAMSPQARLSQFSSVVVSARLSKSGDALPHSGDLLGQAGPLNPSSRGIQVQITIDSVQP